MMGFLRRVFGRHGPTIYGDPNDDGYYDAETQEMILSSFDLMERLQVGDSPDSERAISHFFIGDDHDAQRAAGLFSEWGFLIGVHENNRLQVVERAVVSAEWIERTIPLMCRTGGEFELDYDGWDCGRIVGPNDKLIIDHTSVNKQCKLSAEQIRPLATGRGGAIASDRITVDGRKVGYMYRTAPHNELDSGWSFLAGDETDAYLSAPHKHAIYDVNTIANYDPEIIPLLDAPVGSAFIRTSSGLTPDPQGAPTK